MISEKSFPIARSFIHMLGNNYKSIIQIVLFSPGNVIKLYFLMLFELGYVPGDVQANKLRLGVI